MVYHPRELNQQSRSLISYRRECKSHPQHSWGLSVVLGLKLTASPIVNQRPSGWLDCKR